MKTGRSIHAAAATEVLHACSHINPIIRGAICDPRLGPLEDHPNASFFESVEWYLTCRQVAHAGDTFNTYCQNILAEILTVDPSAWSLVKRHFSAKGSPEKTIARLRIQRESDTAVRDALRESLEAYWCGESEIVVELRNRIVHQSGMDPEGKVEEIIKRFPPCKQDLYPVALDPEDFPVRVDPSGKLQIDARTANWATHHVMHHIDLMDQNLCHRFGLPRKKRPTTKVSFTVLQDSTAFSFQAGQPLPMLPRKNPANSPASLPLPPFPEYDPMASPAEIECAAIWKLARTEIHEFVTEVCNEIGIEIVGRNISVAGSLMSHTLDGHDHHFGYEMQPSGSVNGRRNYLGIRLRQNGFRPFITIWGTNARMRDFHPCELTDEVKDYLQDCIGHTISR